MVVFPSKIEFASFLQYSPQGKSATSIDSRAVRDAVKRDGFVNNVRIIDHAAKRLAEELPKHPFLGDYFNPSVTLIPIPRSSPTKPGTLWPSLRICQAIRARGLAGEVRPHLQRTKPVQKSAFAPPGQRPEPIDHYDSVAVVKADLFTSSHSITLVDDFITRGSSFVGMRKRVEEAFPGVPIRCFALVRTMSSADVAAILDPVEGTITFASGSLNRHP